MDNFDLIVALVMFVLLVGGLGAYFMIKKFRLPLAFALVLSTFILLGFCLSIVFGTPGGAFGLALFVLLMLSIGTGVLWLVPSYRKISIIIMPWLAAASLLSVACWSVLEGKTLAPPSKYRSLSSPYRGIQTAESSPSVWLFSVLFYAAFACYIIYLGLKEKK